MSNVIDCKSFSFTQKLCVAVSTELNKYAGRYVKLNINPNVTVICRVFARRDINPDYCILNKSVVIFKDLERSMCLPVCIDNYLSYIKLNAKDLTLIKNVNNLKTVSVSVIFSNVYCTSKWKSNNATLRKTIKEVLKMFVISSKTVIFTDDVYVCQNLNIYCIVIHKTNSDFGRVVGSTNVLIEDVCTKNWFQLDRTSLNISGVETIYYKLKELCMLESKHSKMSNSYFFSNHVLLSGPPGCGKSSLVQCLASDCGFPLLSIIGPELSSPQPGETEKAIKNVFEEAKLLAAEKPNGVCILLLDKIESLCGKKTHVVRVQSSLIQALDGLMHSRGVFVVATTDRPDLVSPAVRRPPRFTVELVMGVPTENQRCDMLSTLCKDYGVIITDDVCREVARWTPGYVAADLKLLVSDAAQEILKKDVYSGSVNDLHTWQTCVLRMKPSTLRGEFGIVSHSEVKLTDIGGMAHVKRTLKSVVEWPFLYKDSFKRLGLIPTKGILLYGPPGCAKTSLVRAIANSMKTTFLATSAAALYSPYVGDAERTVLELFQRARLGAPTILFIDEIDALVGSRGDDSREKGVHERVLSAFLIEMDGIGTKAQNSSNSTDVFEPSVIVIAATNQPQSLDSALLRPGRFDRLVYVGPPDRNERLDILKKLTEKIPLDESVDLSHIADITELYSGADLSRLCKEAALIAMTKEGMEVDCLDQRHWIEAFTNMKASLTNSQIEFYRNFQFQK